MVLADLKKKITNFITETYISVWNVRWSSSSRLFLIVCSEAVETHIYPFVKSATKSIDLKVF